MLTQNTLTTTRYPSLSGLRAISIIVVILHHLHADTGVIPSSVVRFCPLLFDGQFGVNVFFVISGFLITRLLMKEQWLTQSVSLKKFYARRTLRIFPAYYFLLLVYFIMTCFGFIVISGPSWLTAITYTKYFNYNLDWYTAHAWSLSIEEHFYLIWPLIFIAGPKTRKIFLLSLLCLVPIVRIIFTYHSVSWINELTIFFRIDSLALGCLFALYQDRILEKIAPYRAILLYCTIALLILLPYATTNMSTHYHLHLNTLLIAFGNSDGTLANFAIISILIFSVFTTPNKWFSFLNSRIMNQIGIWSYSLYLWQQLFTYKTDHFINRFPYNILFLLLAALASFYLIEQPFLKLKSRFAFQKNEKSYEAIPDKE